MRFVFPISDLRNWKKRSQNETRDFNELTYCHYVSITLSDDNKFVLIR